jgi:hypothetical protein
MEHSGENDDLNNKKFIMITFMTSSPIFRLFYEWYCWNY